MSFFILSYIAATCLLFQTHSNTGHMTQTCGDTGHTIQTGVIRFLSKCVWNYFSHTWLCKQIIRPYDKCDNILTSGNSHDITPILYFHLRQYNSLYWYLASKKAIYTRGRIYTGVLISKSLGTGSLGIYCFKLPPTRWNSALSTLWSSLWFFWDITDCNRMSDVNNDITS